MLDPAATQVTESGPHCVAAEWDMLNKGGKVTGSAINYEKMYKVQVCNPQNAFYHKLQIRDQYSLKVRS